MRHESRATMDTRIMGSSIFLEHIINLVCQRIKIAQRSSSAAGRSEEPKHVAWFYRGVRSVNVDGSVA
jgi:hypothetical protein